MKKAYMIVNGCRAFVTNKQKVYELLHEQGVKEIEIYLTKPTVASGYSPLQCNIVPLTYANVCKGLKNSYSFDIIDNMERGKVEEITIY